MRKAKRGFERAKYVDIVLRSDLAGAAAAVWESVDEASGGNGASTTLDTVAAVFNRFRRRCGGSLIDVKVLSVVAEELSG